MSEKAQGEDFMRALPDVCESLFPHAVAWRDCIFRTNVDPSGLVHGQANRDELEVLDEFIGICRTLGFDGS